MGEFSKTLFVGLDVHKESEAGAATDTSKVVANPRISA
jgi:hypothetical protein